MIFTVWRSVWFTPGVVLGVGVGLFASCQLLHVLYVWVVGSGSLPFTCDSVDAEFDSIMYSCVHCGLWALLGAVWPTTCSTCSIDIVLYIYCRNYTLNHVLVLQVHISHQPAV